MFWQGLLFYDHTIKECSEKENQEKTMTALEFCEASDPTTSHEQQTHPGPSPWGNLFQAMHFPLFPLKCQTKEHNMPITINEEVQTKNQKKRQKSPIVSYLQGFFHTSNVSEDELIFQYIKPS